MNGWRSSWARAQITGVVFSSLVWIVVWGISLPVLAAILAVGVAAVAGRNTRPMLWWRFGATPVNDFQRDTMLTAIVPIASLRGRHQPSVWIGQRIVGEHVVVPSRTVLVVSPEFVRQVASGQPTDREASAIVCQALGRAQVLDSTLVNALEAYCLPWRCVQILIDAAGQIAARHGLLRLSWKTRWIVFGVATVDNYLNARWPAFVGVILIAMLSCTTGHFQYRWERRCQDLGDQRAISEGLGPDLADLIQRANSSIATSERADRLRRGTPRRTTGPCGPANASPPPPGPPPDRLERRGSASRRHS